MLKKVEFIAGNIVGGTLKNNFVSCRISYTFAKNQNSKIMKKLFTLFVTIISLSLFSCDKVDYTPPARVDDAIELSHVESFTAKAYYVDFGNTEVDGEFIVSQIRLVDTLIEIYDHQVSANIFRPAGVFGVIEFVLSDQNGPIGDKKLAIVYDGYIMVLKELSKGDGDFNRLEGTILRYK